MWLDAARSRALHLVAGMLVGHQDFKGLNNYRLFF